MEHTETKITAHANGPLMVEGRVTIVKPNGETEIKEGKFHLCRCGQSANKPYCDGAHKKCNFVG